MCICIDGERGLEAADSGAREAMGREPRLEVSSRSGKAVAATGGTLVVGCVLSLVLSVKGFLVLSAVGRLSDITSLLDDPSFGLEVEDGEDGEDENELIIQAGNVAVDFVFFL